MGRRSGVTEESLQQAKAWMQRYPVIDGLALGAVSEGFIADCLQGQLTAVNWTVAVAPDTAEEAFMKMLAMRWLVQRLPDKCVLARTVSDVERAHQQRKVALVAGWQGGEPLEDNFYWLEVFWEYGLRILQLCYNQESRIGYGCLEPNDQGLKRFGLEIVRECNRLGVLVDLSHTGVRTTLEAMAASEKPCIFSHSNPRAVCDNPRNVTDEQARACAATGGVIGAVPCTAIITEPGDGRRATLQEWVGCIDYLVELVGTEHVGIGTDLNAYPGNSLRWTSTVKRRYPEVNRGVVFETRDVEGVDSHADFPWLVGALIERGYKEPDVAKIIGGNWLRMFRSVWFE